MGQEQVDAQGDPKVVQAGIDRGCQKALCLQVLLDPLEEGLDLPTGTVDFNDRRSRQVSVIGYVELELARSHR